MNAINLKQPAPPPHGTVIKLGDGLRIRAARMNPFDATLGERIIWQVLTSTGAVAEAFVTRPGADDVRAALSRYEGRQSAAEAIARETSAERARREKAAASRARGGFVTKRGIESGFIKAPRAQEGAK